MFNILSIIIQVVLVLIVVIVLNVLAVRIMTTEKIIEDGSVRTVVPIFKGWVDTQGFSNKKFNTYNRFDKTYRNLPLSVNFNGGAQYSYSFWIKLNNVAPDNLSNKIILLHGDANRYMVNTRVQGNSSSYDWYVTKNPMIRFGDDKDEIIVEFNTTMDLNAKAVINRVRSTDETIRKNVISLIPGKWALMTFVWKDNEPIGDFENGIKFEFYINDMQYHRSTHKGGLKLNSGNINILPTGPIKDGYICDLTYYNYALTETDIRRIVDKGFTNQRFNELETDPAFNEPLYLTKYNRLEIHNV